MSFRFSKNIFCKIYLIYMYKQGLALNNLKGLMCHKTQINEQTNFWFFMRMVLDDCSLEQG